MKNYFIIHGGGGNPYANWFSWLHKKITDKGETLFVPHFPVGQDQSYNNWRKILESYVATGIINTETIFICHALGSVFVTRFVVEKKIKVAGIVSVAGFNSECLVPELSEVNKTFVTKDKNLVQVGRFVKFFHCIYSDNDLYVAFESLMNFAKIVGAKVHEIEKGGHFNSESGFKEFPYLWELLDKINTIV